MLSRKLAINWQYATGEIVIIVVGVLLAISLDSCNEDRIARRTEREYLTRLAEDLRTDTATFNFVERALERKTSALALADSVFNQTAELRDTLGFLQALVSGANFAWNQPRVRTTTFDELQSTGNLRLLRDQDTRAEVIRYYTSAEADYLRIAARRTRYGPLTYELLPRAAEFGLDSTTTRARSSRIINTVLTADLARATVAERNLARLVAELNSDLEQRALALVARIEQNIR